MKTINFRVQIKENKESISNIKTRAEYQYISREKNKSHKTKVFVSKYVSTIDIPYGKYSLK